MADDITIENDGSGGFTVKGALKKLLSQVADHESAEETQRKIENIYEKYNAMSDEHKKEFERNLQSAFSDKLMKTISAGVGQKIEQEIYWRLALFFAVVALLIFLFVFFGYKLYKSIKEKELKREEKKKAKLQKKKK